MKNPSYAIYLSTIAMSDIPMRWYRFLVEFSLVASAIVSIFLNIVVVGTDILMYYENSLYLYFTDSQFGFLNIFSFFLIFFNFVMLLIIRSSLKAFDCKTTHYLLTFAFTNIAYSFIYLIFAISFSFRENAIINISLQFIVYIVFCTLNFFYFKKRKHLFIYDYTEAFKQSHFSYSQYSVSAQKTVEHGKTARPFVPHENYPTVLNIDINTQPKDISHVNQASYKKSKTNINHLFNDEKTLKSKLSFVHIVVIILIAALITSNLFTAFFAGNIRNENNLLNRQLNANQNIIENSRTETKQYKEQIIRHEKTIENLQRIVEDKAFINQYLEVYQTSFAFANETGKLYHKYDCNMLSKVKQIYAVVIYDSDYVACPICYLDY